jgi:hypothetical protein
MWNVSEVAEIPPIPNGCACCGMRFLREPGDRERRHCGGCQDHYAIDGEDAARELARLRDHDQRLRPGFAAAWHQQSRYEGRMKSAMDSRDTWKIALAEVMLAHEEADDGICKACRETAFPCSTWRKLDEANPGIHRRIEALWAMNRHERDHDGLAVWGVHVNRAATSGPSSLSVRASRCRYEGDGVPMRA